MQITQKLTAKLNLLDDALHRASWKTTAILTWLSSEYLWKLLSNSVAGSMTAIEGFLINLWWFSGVVIFICSNIWDKAQNDFASWKQINGTLQVCYKIFEKIQVYVLKMNKIGDSYLPCVAMAHSLQVNIC